MNVVKNRSLIVVMLMVTHFTSYAREINENLFHDAAPIFSNELPTREILEQELKRLEDHHGCLVKSKRHLSKISKNAQETGIVLASASLAVLPISLISIPLSLIFIGSGCAVVCASKGLKRYCEQKIDEKSKEAKRTSNEMQKIIKKISEQKKETKVR